MSNICQVNISVTNLAIRKKQRQIKKVGPFCINFLAIDWNLNSIRPSMVFHFSVHSSVAEITNVLTEHKRYDRYAAQVTHSLNWFHFRFYHKNALNKPNLTEAFANNSFGKLRNILNLVIRRAQNHWIGVIYWFGWSFGSYKSLWSNSQSCILCQKINSSGAEFWPCRAHVSFFVTNRIL